MNFYGMWYRRKKEESELSRSAENKKRALEIIKETGKTIKKKVEAVQYPKFNYNWEIEDILDKMPKIEQEKNNKINILMIIPWMVLGGADRFNIELIKRLDKEKFNFTIITTEPAINNYRQEFEKYSTIYDLTTFIDQKYWMSFIDYIIRKNNINLVFNTNSEMGYSALPYIKAKYQSIPIIDYVHMEEWYNRNGGYSRDSSANESVIDKTLVCNENSRKILIDYFKRKEEETKTVYIGVDTEKFNPEKYNRVELKEKYNLPNDKFIISFICRITEQKRPLLLIDIIKELSLLRQDFLFLIVGEGLLLNEVKAKAKKLDILNYICFLDSTENVQEIYSISDITINCSIKEGLALTSYESLSMGVPVVSSDVGGQKELINNEVGAIVKCLQKEEEIRNINYKKEEINLYVEALQTILKDLDNYKSKCRQRILDGFTLEKMAKEMSDIFEKTYNNPNEEKIKNGEGLGKNISIAKELINKYFVMDEEIYKWECEQYNNYFGFKTFNYKFELFKEVMWQHKWYRGLIKLIKMTGIKRNKD